MKTLTNEQQVFFETLSKEWANQEVAYLYGLVHEMNIEPTCLFVYTNLTPPVMRGLIAYIECVSFEITAACEYSLTEEEIIEIINKFYTEVKVLTTPSISRIYDEIDLYRNWEYHSSFPHEQGMPEWYREGLLDYVKVMSIRHQWANH